MSAALSPDMSYEEAMARLEEVVSALEEGRLPLDKLVDGYEEGMQLLKQCRHQIEVARVRIEKVSADAEGRATLVPFDPAAEPATPAPAAAAAAAPAEDAPVEERPRAVSPRQPRRTKPAEPEEDSDDIRLF